MLGRKWEPGEATIVARKQDESSGAMRGDSRTYEFVADVQPTDGSPAFRATFRRPAIDLKVFHAPEVGQVVHVKFDPKSHKVQFDDPPLRDRDSTTRAHAADLPAIADAPPAHS